MTQGESYRARVPEPHPVVAVIGRPNVGKSTLVNRLAGRRDAVTDAMPGVTRDRKEVDVDWNGRAFRVVDTGGWSSQSGGLEAKVSDQALRAATDADVVLLVVDATVGPTEEDQRIAAILRRTGAATLLVANKVDSDHQEADAWRVERVGMGVVHMVSALHGRGSGDLLDAITELLPGRIVTDRPTAGFSPRDTGDQGEAGSTGMTGEDSVSIVGRPNVGKSTLFNRIIGDERSITHDEPGTTRDSIDTVVQTEFGRIRFVDTAGIRRKSTHAEGAEFYAMARALSSIDKSDVALLIIDSTAGVTHQDQRLAERVDAAGSPVVIVLNKWDLLTTESRAAVVDEVEDRLAFLGYAPVLKLSALTGRGVHKLLPAIRAASEAYHRRVPTAELNRAVRKAQDAHGLPRGIRILYATQGAVDPPTFTIFTNRPVPRTYLRYLERAIREYFNFGPTPLKIRVRRRGGSR